MVQYAILTEKRSPLLVYFFVRKTVYIKVQVLFFKFWLCKYPRPRISYISFRSIEWYKNSWRAPRFSHPHFRILPFLWDLFQLALMLSLTQPSSKILLFSSSSHIRFLALPFSWNLSRTNREYLCTKQYPRNELRHFSSSKLSTLAFMSKLLPSSNDRKHAISLQVVGTGFDVKNRSRWILSTTDSRILLNVLSRKSFMQYKLRRDPSYLDLIIPIHA